MSEPLMIEVFAMNGETIAEPWEETEYYDILVRPDGGDPIEERENLTWEQVEEIMPQLHEKYPDAGYDEIGGRYASIA